MSKATITFLEHRVVEVELDGIQFVSPATLRIAEQKLRKVFNSQKAIVIQEDRTSGSRAQASDPKEATAAKKKRKKAVSKKAA